MEALLPTEIIKAEALRLGFSACGAAPAEAVSEKVADTFRRLPGGNGLYAEL